MSLIETYFHLPPGPLGDNVAEALFRLVVGRRRWVNPARYRTAGTEEPIPGGEDAATILGRLYKAEGLVTAAGKGGELVLSPDRVGERTTNGFFAWFTPRSATSRAAWRRRHIEETAAVAKLLRSPLAWAALEGDYRRKKYRNIPAGTFSEDLPRVRGYDHGLLALYWRNIFGPPFATMFEDRLRELPADVVRSLGEGYWLVEPYATPGEALTEAGRRRAADLIAQIGPEFFYDMQREQPPSRRPAPPFPPVGPSRSSGG